MQPVRPLPLVDGATIGIVSVSAPEPVTDEAWFSRGLKALGERGFHIKTAAHIDGRRGYLSGSEQQLAADLHDLFRAPDVQAIICAGGGVNANRLLRNLDLDLIAANPKVLVGVSNPTVILNAITVRTGLITFHGPSVVWDLGAEGGLPATTAAHFWGLLQSRQAEYEVSDRDSVWQWLRPGAMSGRLFGGNLASVQGLLGTAHEPDWSDSVFLWEDIAKPTNRLDMALTHFRDVGVFDRIAGMIVGRLVSCDPPDGGQTLEEMLGEVLSGYDFPVLLNVPFGHTSEKITLPIGATVSITPEKPVLTFQLPELSAEG
jgi:muramoyltetrapeptide carboxypeptidase